MVEFTVLCKSLIEQPMFKSTKYNDLAKQVKDVSKVKSRVTAVQVEAKAFAVTSKNKQEHTH